MLVMFVGIPILLIGGCKILLHRGEVSRKEKENRRQQTMSDSNSDSGSDDVHGAWASAQRAVLKELKSPKSADFPFGGYRHITPLGGDRYRVDSYVDAKNSFGAEIRTHFSGVVKKVSGGWQVEELNFRN